jgi:predicted ATP-grasp superfamily ATP-dependent carboligase
MPRSECTPILLADDSHYIALATARALRAANYAPWLAVHESGTHAASSRATAGTVRVPDPSLDSEGFVRELAAAAAQLSAAAVLPTGVDHHLLILAEREDDFPGIRLGTPSRESVERATDKALLPELATSAGLRTPPTKKVVRGDSGAVGTFGFPAIVKPLRSRIRKLDGKATRYTSRLTSRYVWAKQVQEALDDLPGGVGLIQPYIPGTLVSVSGVSWKGELVCALHQASIRIWPVPAGGSSYAVTIPPDAELEQGVARLLRVICWSGIFQAQFIRDPHGEHYLIDLNPRVYGSLALAVAAGLNLPGIWVDLLLGRRPYVEGYRIGVRFRHEGKDVRALAQMLADGERLHALRGFVPRRDTTHAIFSLRDPMPRLRSVEKLIKRLWPQ